MNIIDKRIDSGKAFDWGRIHFTRESWNGRMKACRGVGASLADDEIASWERELIALLEAIAPDKFDVLHYAALAELKKK